MVRETPPTTKFSNGRQGIGAGSLHKIPGMRGAIAALVLTAGVAGVLIAADSGRLRVGAGDVDIVLARGDSGYTMSVAGRSCPPRCSFDFDWRPS